MTKMFPRPTGELIGDDRPLPMRGTGTGSQPNMMLDGRSIEQDAVNRLGPLTGTESDMGDETMPCDHLIGGKRGSNKE